MADQDERESLLDAWISLTTIINNDRLVSVLPYNEAVVCRILLQHVDEDITATELCKVMNMQKSQMNHTLAAMEHKKLIVRKRCTSDKRRIFIRLNEAEMDVYNRQHAQVMQIVENLIATLGEEQTKQVIKLLRVLADTADKELGNHKDQLRVRKTEYPKDTPFFL